MATHDSKQLEILQYIYDTVENRGFPPTVREICQELHIKSTSTTHKDIANLEKKGYIRKDPSKPRALMIMDPDSLPESPSSTISTTGPAGITLPMARENAQVVDIPVVGRIAAGTPILADQNVEDTFPVPARYVSKGVHFMLNVRGDSMIEAGIHDGDLILVEQQNVARNGDIVVAKVNGMESEATVKTFYKESDHIRLQPENSTMEPIRVKDVTILGKVRGVFRYFN